MRNARIGQCPLAYALLEMPSGIAAEAANSLLVWLVSFPENSRFKGA